ncbi:MAG: hypothetical protein ACM3WV_01980 [Bacillota bacterium]
MDKKNLEEKVAGKKVASLDVSMGTLKVIFADGSMLAREKSCDGEITVVYYNPLGKPEVSLKIWG